MSSDLRTALPAFCPLQAAVIFPLTRISSVRPSSVVRRLLVSPSSRNSAKNSRISTLATWRMKEVVSAIRSIHCSGCRPLFRLARGWYTPICPRFEANVKMPWPRPPRSLEKRASQALISHVDLPPERGSDGPSTVNICRAPVSPSIVMACRSLAE